MPFAQDIADAVKAELDATTWSQTITPEVTLDPEMDREATRGEIKTPVIATGTDRAFTARKRRRSDYGIVIGVNHKISNDGTTALELVDLVEEILDHFHGKVLSAGDPSEDIRCMEAEADPLYDFSSLHNNRVFLSGITLAFKRITSL